MIKIPKVSNSELGLPVSFLGTKTMCGTCAYKTPSSEDEDFMTRCYHAELALPHPCHERRRGYVCKGALETFKRLGLEIDMSLLGTRP